MSSKTKIVVLHMKEVIYTAIFVSLAILTLILLFIMFGPKEDAAQTSAQAEAPKYVAGVYSTSIELNDNTFDVQVTVDTSQINSIQLVNLSESTTAMYPLMEPTLDILAAQICETQSTDDIVYEEENKYTSMLLLEAIKTALSKAVPQN